jgi:hypothetical protein
MQCIFTKTLIIFFSLSFICHFLSASSFEDEKKTRMIHDLEVIKYHLEAGYAPAEWKKEYSGWDLDEAFEHSKDRILATSFITTKQFQIIVRDFIRTMKDYHVDILFFSTEVSSLPFSVKGAEGRYFIQWIDPLRLPPSHYAIRVGDELLEFGERQIKDVIEELKIENSKSANSKTDQTLAEMKLTWRKGMAGDVVPQGPIMIKTRSSASGKIGNYQLCWSYTPEYVQNSLDFLPLYDVISGLKPSQKAKEKIKLPQKMIASLLQEVFAKQRADGGMGSRKSFLPMLGEQLWIKPETGNEDDLDWHAYIYRHPKGHSIGYIRIPHYQGFRMHAHDFGEIINLMEEKTDALVIDQIHNPGGDVGFQYELASILAKEPMRSPYHRVKITQKEVLEAYQSLERIRLIDLGLHGEGIDDYSSSENEDGEDGYHTSKNGVDPGVNYQEILFLKSYYELILEEWSKGHTLTRPTPILGFDSINPHPKYQYTKPILMLIDEMDFSGGDFVPAILQDNRRALLFGSRTAGAGGYVFSFEFPNTHGIRICSYTASIAERVDLQKIENIGVIPDIEYQISADDLQNDFHGYVEAVNQSVHHLLENEQK